MTESSTQTSPSRIDLPGRPTELATKAVAAWGEPVWIDTYLPEAAEAFPSFLANRVYQGSSGRVFPLPVIERINSTKKPHQWQAIHLENDFVRLMILPELGGRIHIGYNKVDGYDFFYRNNVIKPALVGLTGPWISGGVEFNWPQHHRPATFLPTAWDFESEPDGSVTVWCFDNDPMNRMSAAHGIRLRPDSSLIEARVRLYNRSDVPQTFLWWANVAARVNDDYQSFFPEDVHAVADHAKRAVTGFPRATTPYYGIDYLARVNAENPDADRIDYYKNIPVPTSYMVANTKENFFGGYDHAAQSGFVHWADRHIAPGKKQWTWGNSEFGRAWDDNLSDGDGPYVELMAGVFTDNQPDFAYLAPGETKSFSQYWYPITKIGPAHAASLEAALNVQVTPGPDSGTTVSLKVAATRALESAELTLTAAKTYTTTVSAGALSVDNPVEVEITVPFIVRREDLSVEVMSAANPLVHWNGAAALADTPIDAVREPPLAEALESPEELVTIGRYLRQYRHATRDPRPYFQRALHLDDKQVEARIYLAELALDAADLHTADDFMTAALTQLTSRTPTPRDGYGLYLAGLIAHRLGEHERALDLLGRAQWDAAVEAPARYLMALQYKAQGSDRSAAAHVREILAKYPQHRQAQVLATVLGISAGPLEPDDLHTFAHQARPHVRQLARQGSSSAAIDPTLLLDEAVDLLRMSEPNRAQEILVQAEQASESQVNGQVNVLPLIHYYQARLLADRGFFQDAEEHIASVEREGIMWSLPTRFEDIEVLGFITKRWPDHGPAKVLLADWYFENGRVREALELWTSATSDTSDALTTARAWRGIGIARYNELRDPQGAAVAFAQARDLQPDSAKLLFEADQLAQRMQVDVMDRREHLERHPKLLPQRDDLFVSYLELLIVTGRAEEAAQKMTHRRFQPWEGGEGKVLRTWEAAHESWAAQLADNGEVHAAIAVLQDALRPPNNLGEAVHPLANRSRLLLALGDLYNEAGTWEKASELWRKAAASTGDFVQMADTKYSPESIYAAIAQLRLDQLVEAQAFASAFTHYIDTLEQSPVRIDYFATSLPNMLLFSEPISEVRAQEVEDLREALARIHTEIDHYTQTKEQQ